MNNRIFCLILVLITVFAISTLPVMAEDVILPDLTDDSIDPFTLELYGYRTNQTQYVDSGELPTYTSWIPTEVEMIQNSINYWFATSGYSYRIAVDGTFGPETSKAVKYFQYRNGLQMDGVVGPETQKLLGLGNQLSEKYYFYNVDLSKIRTETGWLIYTSLVKKETSVYQYVDNHWSLVGTVSCTIGKNSTPTPTGIFCIVAKKESLTEYPEARYCTGIGDGIYFHTTLSRNESTGKARSHGCIRLKEKHAVWIYNNIPYGTAVIIDDRYFS